MKFIGTILISNAAYGVYSNKYKDVVDFWENGCVTDDGEVVLVNADVRLVLVTEVAPPDDRLPTRRLRRRPWENED